jgi:hypothetical protein
MLRTYRAILRGDRLEWTGEGPKNAPGNQGVEVLVTILPEERSPPSQENRGAAMAAALRRLADAGGSFRNMDEQERLAEMESLGLVTLPKRTVQPPFQHPALPNRGKLASEMVIKDRR